jgi:histidine triad (HIT) family protein
MSDDCIFCKIIAKEIPGDVVYADEYVTAFRDIQPAAPTHILIVPNKHIPSVNALSVDDADLLGKMNLAAQQIAKDEGVAESGYRLIVNNGPDAGQLVFHLHMHLLAGKKLGVLA